MASDAQDSQKEIFSKIQSLLAFLDATETQRSRENLEQWKEVLESLRDITANPLPFLLEILKTLKSRKNSKKEGAKAKKMKAAGKKTKKGKTGDADFKATKKTFAQKFNLDPAADVWLRTLNGIIREAIINVLPRVDDILYEEIIKAFSCDLSMLVPVVGDGLTNPILIKIAEIDLLKQLYNDPASDVGKYMYEAGGLNFGAYPVGQTPFPVNIFLHELIMNNGGNFSTPGTTQTIYGKSGRALFDVISIGNGQLEIYPYYKVDNDPGGQPNYQTSPGSPLGTGALPGNSEKFTILEFLKDYFQNIKLIEMQNLLAALMEILTGFMSVRNKNINLDDIKAVQKFLNMVENILASCDGADLGEISTDSVSHLSELYDDDSFFEFNIEEERNIELESVRKSKNVISFESCGVIDVPVDNAVVDDGLDDILSSANQDEQIKAFDLVLQRFAAASAAKEGYDLSLGSMSLPLEIDFKENLIKKLPQILAYGILNPKGVLPVVLTAKMLNQNATSVTSIDMWAKIFKRVLIRVIKEFLNEVGRILLRYLKQILLKLIQQLIKEKLSEKAKKRLRIIKKLIDILFPLITALQNAKNCKEIYQILLTTLMANMPDLPFGVPPFLVAAAKMRPGTSALGTFERLISKLQAAGIPVGDMPDGSPNLMLIHDFLGIQSDEEERSENASVSSVIMMGQVIHPLGPGLIKPFTTADGILK